MINNIDNGIYSVSASKNFYEPQKFFISYSLYVVSQHVTMLEKNYVRPGVIKDLCSFC